MAKIHSRLQARDRSVSSRDPASLRRRRPSRIVPCAIDDLGLLRSRRAIRRNPISPIFRR